MTLARRLRTIIDQQRLITKQQELLNVACRKLVEQEQGWHDQMNAMRLEHAREIQGILSGWLISIETPEVDLREELAALERNLGLQIAKLEEHIL